MDSYLQRDAVRICAIAHPEIGSRSALEPVYLVYAVLLRAKGGAVTASDVHDAWSAAQLMTGGSSAAIVPYGDLDAEQQAKDEIYVSAIRRAASASAADKPGG